MNSRHSEERFKEKKHFLRKRRARTIQALEMKPTQAFKLQPDIQQNKQLWNKEKLLKKCSIAVQNDRGKKI